MFRVESRGGAVIWRQGETSAPTPTGTLQPRPKWSAGGRGFRARCFAHVAAGASSGVDGLTATGITTAQPTLGTPAIGQVHAIAAAGITTGQPVIGSPSIGQVHALVASSITTGQPTLGSPVLDGTPGAVDLIANGIVSGIPALGIPDLRQVHVIAATGITAGIPAMGAPYLTDGVPAEVVFGSLNGTLKKPYPGRTPKVQTVTR